MQPKVSSADVVSAVKKSKFYDNGNQGARTWRSCDWAGHKVILVAPSYRVNCPKHGVVTCKYPWARHDSKFTYKFEEMTAWMAVNCSKSAVAAFMRISWNTVGPIISRVEKDLDINPEERLTTLFESVWMKPAIGKVINISQR